jgi:thiol-disulfide isomerase/thioredoxin
MTNQNKVLLVSIAIVAFVVGVAVNSSRSEPLSKASALLSAQLETSDPSTGTAGTDSVQNQLADLTLVNFWATWCTPCREEMPLFEAMYRLHKKDGFTIIGIAIDNPGRSQPFLDSMDISYPILYAEVTGMQLLEESGNPQGLLPYSLLLDKDGNVLDQVLGKIDEARIQAWLAEHL